MLLMKYSLFAVPIISFVHRLLAKLDKADRALCFTSGMAALSAVTHLVGTGTFSFLFVCWSAHICILSDVSAPSVL